MKAAIRVTSDNEDRFTWWLADEDADGAALGLASVGLVPNG